MVAQAKISKQSTQTNTGNKPVTILTYRIIEGPNNTFGYDILKNNKTFIHQPIVPGIGGTNGFGNKQDAQKVAKLIMNKLAHNIMPPTVEKRELDSLHIKL